MDHAGELHRAGAAPPTGREVWRRDLGPWAGEHGFGASPVLFDKLLIVPNDQDGKSFCIALDRRTGETRWQTDRKSEKAAYSTPIIFRPEGGPAIDPHQLGARHHGRRPEGGQDGVGTARVQEPGGRLADRGRGADRRRLRRRGRRQARRRRRAGHPRNGARPSWPTNSKARSPMCPCRSPTAISFSSGTTPAW